MNTNDFSKCKVGDKRWHLMYGEVFVLSNRPECEAITLNVNGSIRNTQKVQNPETQELFFSKPQIIAPPEPIRLPDYKDGEWIAVWDDDSSLPILSRFLKFIRGGVRTYSNTSWQHSCRLAELPEVLAKWGEK